MTELGYVLQIVGVAIAYTASGKLGLHFAFASHSVTAIWPPTGIALATLVLGGYRAVAGGSARRSVGELEHGCAGGDSARDRGRQIRSRR